MSESYVNFFNDVWAMPCDDPGGEFICNDIYEIAIKHGLAEWRSVDPSENEWGANNMCFRKDIP